MAAITIKDLRTSRELDRKAMSCVRGAGAPWVYGWIRPHTTSSGSFGTVINFFQVNNYAEQMVNQFQTVEINNTGANSNINVGLDQSGGNLKQQ
ncbi:hypothetical protein [Noviherbaspirillum sedimenti]|uniref:Uncharacterized protein n=1 Tax=Noviherbaspirillum sedimenti TaxID=2320865 RepID=A0A3A3FXP7_9BURK|nr:hypothetical protein [Noviherbaspirillum sedimenti]RJG00401.1 hypothetical protein D3878_01410 [Noviherbaspirillum sedimenti]